MWVSRSTDEFAFHCDPVRRYAKTDCNVFLNTVFFFLGIKQWMYHYTKNWQIQQILHWETSRRWLTTPEIKTILNYRITEARFRASPVAKIKYLRRWLEFIELLSSVIGCLLFNLNKITYRLDSQSYTLSVAQFERKNHT